MDAFDKVVAGIFKGLPALPTNVRNLLVQLTPWFNLLGLLLALPAVLMLLGLGALATSLLPYAVGWASGYGYGLGVVFAIVLLVLHAMAARPLFAHKAVGWKYVYWATLVSGLESLLLGNFIGFIIGTGISLYILFQVKSHFV